MLFPCCLQGPDRLAPLGQPCLATKAQLASLQCQARCMLFLKRLQFSLAFSLNLVNACCRLAKCRVTLPLRRLSGSLGDV